MAPTRKLNLGRGGVDLDDESEAAEHGDGDDEPTPLRRRASTDPDKTMQLFIDSRFDTSRSWWGDIRFAIKRYAFGALFGAPNNFPVLSSTTEQNLVRSVAEAEACDEDSEDEEAQTPSNKIEVEEKQGALAILRRLATKPSMLAIRFLGWALSKIFRSAFTTVHIHNSHVVANAVEEVRERNARVSRAGKKTALILLPTHRSHADYLLLSFIFFGLDLPVPCIAAGDNLNVPLLGRLLSASGAFFIRRAAQSERYRLVLQGYLYLLCKSGVPIEFFIEGGRSRRGSVGRPKVGLLSLIIQMVKDGDLDDALLVPLSIDYDRVPEGNGFANEVLGVGKKKPESLLGTLRAWVEWMIWGKREGAVYVGFCDETLSVRDLLHELVGTEGGNGSGTHAHHHNHMHANVGGTMFRGGSTATLVLAQDNALAHEIGRIVVDAQRECALVGSGALAACAMLMQRGSIGNAEANLGQIQHRMHALHRLLIDMGHGHRIPPVNNGEVCLETVHTLLRGASDQKRLRICLRYAAAPVMVRLLPACAAALGGDFSLYAWLAGMYDIEKPRQDVLLPVRDEHISATQARDLAELVAPMIFLLECALELCADGKFWPVGETKAEEDVVGVVRAKLSKLPFAELAAPLEIASAFRACVIQGVLRRTNVRRGKDTLAAYTLLPTAQEAAANGLKNLKQARAALDYLLGEIK